MINNNKTKALIHISESLPIICQLPEGNFSSTCLEKINTALIDAVYMLGYHHIRYFYWVKNFVDPEQEINSFCVNLSSFPEEWEIFYDRHNMYRVDPVVRIIRDSVGQKSLIYGTWKEAYLWALQNIPGQDAMEKEQYIKDVMELVSSSRRYQLNSGYYYSWGDGTVQIVLSLGSTQDSIEQKNGSAGDFIRIIHSMAILINRAITATRGCKSCHKSLRVYGSRTICLSQAELYVLQLFHRHRNATLKQIATHYGRSVDTVNHHLRSIRSKFNTPGASGHSLAAYAVDLKLI